MVAGRVLRLELLARCRVHCSVDGWRSTIDVEARDSGLGVWIADLPGSDELPAGAAVDFTFHWSDADRWEGRDFRVAVVDVDGTSGV
jgi:glucoamylase